MNQLFKYLNESRQELQKVVWPDRKQTTNHTVMVIAISLLVAAFLGVLDYILNRVLDLII